MAAWSNTGTGVTSGCLPMRYSIYPQPVSTKLLSMLLECKEFNAVCTCRTTVRELPRNSLNSAGAMALCLPPCFASLDILLLATLLRVLPILPELLPLLLELSMGCLSNPLRICLFAENAEEPPLLRLRLGQLHDPAASRSVPFDARNRRCPARRRSVMESGKWGLGLSRRCASNALPHLAETGSVGRRDRH